MVDKWKHFKIYFLLILEVLQTKKKNGNKFGYVVLKKKLNHGNCFRTHDEQLNTDDAQWQTKFNGNRSLDSLRWPKKKIERGRSPQKSVFYIPVPRRTKFWKSLCIFKNHFWSLTKLDLKYVRKKSLVKFYITSMGKHHQTYIM